jgi:predicted RecA/RadA family phage recombinase
MTASLYSPSLRIELIPNGEQSGTWGTTTNLNLGTLLEDGITGYVDVIASAISPGVLKYPLTTNNGAVDEARSAIVSLAVDGTIAAAYEVFIPPVPKTYIMRNTTAYDATIFVSTVDGNVTPKGTGLTIPAGKTVQIWTEGTNLYSSLTDIAGSLTLATPLPSTSGGTGLAAPIGVLVGNNTGTAITTVAPGTAGNLLQSDGVTWIASTAGAGSVAGGTIYETNTTLTQNYTLTAGKNGMTVGPFLIASGASLTVPTGARFVVI